MKGFSGIYGEVLEGNVKRLEKILHALIVAESPASFELLDLLLKEEREKRLEERARLIEAMPSVQSPATPVGKALLVLILEASDDTVIHLMERHIMTLKQYRGIE